MMKRHKALLNIIPYYGIAAVWIIYALVFDLYEVKHFFLVAVLSALVFFTLKTISREVNNAVIATTQETSLDTPTENSELDVVIKNGRQSLTEIHKLNTKIKNPKMAADINRMEIAIQKIFDSVLDHPEHLPQIGTFLDYYLPTTLKLLRAYHRFNSTGISGKNIDVAKKQIGEILAHIASAFETQLDDLYGNEAFDISSEIAALEVMLKREGLTGDRLEAQTTKDSNGHDIRLGE